MTPFQKTLKAFFMTIPIMLGMIVLIGFFQSIVTQENIINIFNSNIFANTFIAASIGSVAAGNPATSYVIGGEMLNLGVDISAIVAFLVAWVTAGVIQLPAEIMMLGRKFAIVRNLLAFISSILIGFLTYMILQIW